MKPAKFIVIEGLDGSGKSTQLEMLQAYLTAQNIAFRNIHFPRLDEGIFGTLVSEFLRGAFGRIEVVHPKLVALLFAGDRKDFASTIMQWLNEDFLVIADRYVYSNIAFQCAKLDLRSDKQELKEWILQLEYGYYQIPRPDHSMFLDVSNMAAARALSDDDLRANREYLSGGQDIHETDFDFQERVHQEYLALIEDHDDIDRVLCVDEFGSRLSPELTHRAIIQKLQERQIFRSS